ncbi:type II toxin-antitoxin system VapC family toxin [Candidatus Chloroploca sp. M-50]|uniref:Ribonuclease VapC n=1 Tax=Candidatus Chloroploca mongolica TaxID=2528176 RepID=A0ABS4DFR6_9CHLR|nr:type II toxin-antitoxin system VapC family toxin [Candidatus Chloroploca mongolica]MBP1468209.1 type II toxin-antitoxin system VapC family toxin [Candidatus Chloroploca mongolica]
MTTPLTPVLIDTDVLIDYLRDKQEAVAYVDNLTVPLFLSVINVAELYAGVRDGAERTKLDAFINAFTIVPLDREIGVTGGLYRRDYGKSHGTGLADALIAATARLHSLTLVTLNKKHFPMLTSLIVPY